MKKIIAIVFSTLFVAQAALAELAIGITGAYYSLDTDGSETELTGNLEKSSASSEENVEGIEIFGEIVTDTGFVLGASYIPARELGATSRSDTNTEGDTGTYTAKAEVDNVVMFYADVPIGPLYAKFGISRAELTTQESLNSGSTYDNEEVFGFTVGLGKRGDFYGGTFYKAEFSYTDFDSYEDTSSDSEKKVEADTEVMALKLSLGKAF